MSYHSNAQSPCIQWQKTYGGTEVDGDDGSFQDFYDYAISVEQTNDGGYITCGYSASNNGDLTSNHGGGDMWVVKTDAAGTLQWQRSYGGSGPEVPFAIRKTADGGYIFTGTTESTDGDVSGGHVGPNGVGDIWVVKIDATGNIQWQKTLGGSSGEGVFDIRTTKDGGSIVCGFTNSNDGDVSGDHGTGEFNSDIWIVKLSATGSLQWQKCIGGSSYDWAAAVRQTLDGGYILTGSSESKDGDIPFTTNSVNCVVAKLTATGNIEWLKLFSGVAYQVLFDVVQNADGSYAAAGVSAGHPWIVKLSNTGIVLWNKFPGDHLFSRIGGVLEITSDNGYILSTYQLGIADIDNTIYKLDANGNDEWQKTLGGSENDYAASAIQTADGGYMIASLTKSSDGDITFNHGKCDLWLVKLGPLSPPSATVTQPDCSHPTGTITVSNPIGASYQYTIGTSFQAAPVFANLAPASYQVKYKGTDGCVSAAATLVVLPVVPTFTTAPQGAVSKTPSCTNASGGEIVVYSPLGSNFSYSIGGAYQASPVFSGLTAIAYPVTVKDNLSGCISPVFSLAVTGPVPAAAPVVNGAKLCGPGSVTLSATGAGTIRWYSDAALANLVFTGSAYTLTLNATTSFYVTAGDAACTSPAKIITGTISAIPPKPFSENDLKLCPGASLVLNAGNAEKYLWQDNSTNRTFDVRDPGIYSVKITNTGGCSSSATVKVISDQQCNDLYFANAFTPDGNGTNDLFGAIGNYSFITHFSLEVFDRYGTRVFFTNDPAKKWNGLYRGQPYNTNTFGWHSQYYFRNEYRDKKGTVVLVR